MEDDDVIEVYANTTSSTPSAASEATSNKSQKRKYKATSSVWEFFEKVYAPGASKAQICVCKKCKTQYRCESKIDTSTLRRHAEKCYKDGDGTSQQILQFTSQESRETALGNWKFDQLAVRKAIAKMIVIDEMPFSTIERVGFRGLLQVGMPQFNFVTRQTITQDCLEIYQTEKRKLKKLLREKVQTVFLTTDMWTSIQNVGYLCLTAHFIDASWHLHKKIISFSLLPCAHTGEAIASAIDQSLREWKISSVCIMTVDNASSNDVAIHHLKHCIGNRNGLLFDGEFFHVRCAAHILNLIVKDGLKEIGDAIARIRAAVRFVRCSPSRLRLFKECIKKYFIRDKGALVLDVPTRWNSTYLMLESALRFRRAFEQMELEDVSFIREDPPTHEDWNKATQLIAILKQFHEVTRILSGSSYVTANLYFVEVCKTQRLLRDFLTNHDPLIVDMCKRMKEKFDKYWGDIDKINMILVIAIVSDPRYKLKYLRFQYSLLYNAEKVSKILIKVQLKMQEVFKSYQAKYTPMTVSQEAKETSDGNEKLVESSRLSGDASYKDFFKKEAGLDVSNELDRYSKDPKEIDDDDDDNSFDILAWWASSRYRVLSHTARDILAIPVSTVASESAFSTGGRVLDPFRSSLQSHVVEALICAQDWLRSLANLQMEGEDLVEIGELVEAARGGIESGTSSHA